MRGKTLPRTFYTRDDVTGIARELLGKVLFTDIAGNLTGGIITETEAYHERERACHAYNRKNTPRTQTLFEEGGRAYVYLCYGIHHLFNVVTGPGGIAQAVLIRAVFPFYGIDHMLERREMDSIEKKLSSGPGTLSQALGIRTHMNGLDLCGDRIWIEDTGITPGDREIRVSTRVGVDYAGQDAGLPWRFNMDTGVIHQIAVT